MAEQVRGLNEMLARYRVAEAALAAANNGAGVSRAAATPRADAPVRSSERRGGQRPWVAKGGKPAAATGGADAPARKVAARANGSGADAEWREF
jgi:hypothetical protein